MVDQSKLLKNRTERKSALLLAGLGLALLLLFAGMAIAVAPPTVAGRWDAAAQSALAEGVANRTALYRVSAGLTHVGDKIVLVLVALIAALLVWRSGETRFALYWLTITAGGLLAIEAVKHVVSRARPPGELNVAMSPSFPSGHAAGVMLVGSMLAYLLCRTGRQWARIVAVLLMLSVIPLGISRIILGVHWLTDVFGGWLFGAGWALIGVALLMLLHRSQTAPSNPAKTPSTKLVPELSDAETPASARAEQ